MGEGGGSAVLSLCCEGGGSGGQPSGGLLDIDGSGEGLAVDGFECEKARTALAFDPSCAFFCSDQVVFA